MFKSFDRLRHLDTQTMYLRYTYTQTQTPTHTHYPQLKKTQIKGDIIFLKYEIYNVKYFTMEKICSITNSKRIKKTPIPTFFFLEDRA